MPLKQPRLILHNLRRRAAVLGIVRHLVDPSADPQIVVEQGQELSRSSVAFDILVCVAPLESGRNFGQRIGRISPDWRAQCYSRSRHN
jgi:hypothetical protein